MREKRGGVLPEVLSFRLLLLLFCFFRMVSLCGPGYPGTSSVDQVALELTEITCLCLLSAGIKGMCYHALLCVFCLYVNMVTKSMLVPVEVRIG